MASLPANPAAAVANDFPLTTTQIVEDLLALESNNIPSAIFASNSNLFSGSSDKPQVSFEEFLLSLNDKSDEEIHELVAKSFKSTSGSAAAPQDAVAQYIMAVRWMGEKLRPTLSALKQSIVETRNSLQTELASLVADPNEIAPNAINSDRLE